MKKLNTINKESTPTMNGGMIGRIIWYTIKSVMKPTEVY